MKLLERLQALGCRLKLIQVAPAERKTARKITTQTMSLQDLMAQMSGEDVRKMEELPGELTVPFEKVFASLGLKTDAGAWTIDRLRQVLRTDKYRDMDRREVHKSILELLAAEHLTAEALVKDAQTRQQVLVTFESFLEDKMQQRLQLRENRIAENERRRAALQEECVHLNDETRQDAQRLKEWREQKSAYEQEITGAVEFLLGGRGGERTG